MQNKFCPQCKTPVYDELPGGLCPACLMAAARQSQQEIERTQAARPGTTAVPTPREISALFPELDVLEFIGRGGMGTVYKVRQKNLDRIVALKLFLDRPDDPEFSARFQREARALARLNHANIVTVHDFGVRDHVQYLIMEFVDGLNLRQLTIDERLSPEMALEMVPQLCDALQYAHDNGVIHRDIKPENLLIDTGGRVKIADFGLAKLTGGEFNGTLTRTQQIMGTFNYMAPEQRERPTQVDHRADIYSLGVVIYELLTGELPIGRFQPPSSKSAVNSQLDEVVMRALEKEPERRYQHASDFKTGFQSVPEFEPASTPVPPVKHFAGTPGMAPHALIRGTRCLISFMSGREKKGKWVPGDPQMALTLMGGTMLDLTEVEATQINLTLLTVMGAVEVIVPRGANVDLDGFILMGATVDKIARGPAIDKPMNIRIKSWGAMGGCEVRTPTVKEARAKEAIRRRRLRKPPAHDVSLRSGLVMIYQFLALLVTFAVPVIFIASSFDLIDDGEGKMIGILTAITAGLIWSGLGYFRILVGAGPENDDDESIREYYQATKVGTLIRSLGLVAGFVCPMFFVVASHEVGNETELRFAGIMAGILCAMLYIGADKIEEFFYGELEDDV